jgi:hypothetical protein
MKMMIDVEITIARVMFGSKKNNMTNKHYIYTALQCEPFAISFMSLKNTLENP